MIPNNQLTLCQNLIKIGPVLSEILHFESWILRLNWQTLEFGPNGCYQELYKWLYHSDPQVVMIKPNELRAPQGTYSMMRIENRSCLKLMIFAHY